MKTSIKKDFKKNYHQIKSKKQKKAVIKTAKKFHLFWF